MYTDINDTTLVNNGDFFDIDFNNDGITDVTITLAKYSGYSAYNSMYYSVGYVIANGQNSIQNKNNQ